MIFTISILDGIKYINLSFRITFGKLITPVIRLIQKSKEIEMKTLFIVTLLIAGMLTTYTQACTRVVYLGKNGMIVRTNHGLERRFKIQYLRVPQRN